MIICRSPYRVSFFGGGTDYEKWFKKNSGAFLSSAINYYCYSIINLRDVSAKPNYRVIWRIIENVSKLEKIEQPIVREALKLIKPKYTSGEYIYLGDLPSRSGIGSSSAYAVSVIHSLLTSKNIQASKYEIADLAYKLEFECLRENIGIQDSIAASFGGLNFVKIKKNGKYVVSPLMLDESQKQKFYDRILLVFSDEQRTASSMAKKTIIAMKSKEKAFFEFEKMAIEAKDLILKSNFDLFGEMLREAWEIKSSLTKNMTTKRVDEIIETAKKSGVLGYKLLGAGGGGFIMLFFKEGMKKKFYLKNKDIFFIIEPKIDEKGSVIVENKKNVWTGEK